MNAEAAAMHRVFEEMQELLVAAFPDGRVERRSDLFCVAIPSLPVPQCNGPWVIEDSDAAVGALAAAVAEIDESGAPAWVQTRSAHERTRQAARELGLTHEETSPGMVLRRGELAEPPACAEIRLVRDEDVDETNALLAAAFVAPQELFDRFCRGVRSLEAARWYVALAGGEIVSTAVGFTHGGATGVFNVGTAPAHRGRGYGAAVTARAARDGFDAGAGFAFLQSSESGHGVYRRLGFRDVERYTLLTRPFASA